MQSTEKKGLADGLHFVETKIDPCLIANSGLYLGPYDGLFIEQM